MILDEFIKGDPNNIKVLNQLASLLLFEDNKEKAIEYKLRVYKYYKFNKNRKKQKEAKAKGGKLELSEEEAARYEEAIKSAKTKFDHEDTFYEKKKGVD